MALLSSETIEKVIRMLQYARPDDAIKLMLENIGTSAEEQENIEDIVGAMVSGNTEYGIDVTYDDGATPGKLDFQARSVFNNQTTGYTALLSDISKVIRYTGAGGALLSLTEAATLGDGWFARVVNDSTGIITIDPASSETIDSSLTKALYPGDDCLLYCDGALFVTTLIRNESEIPLNNLSSTSNPVGSNDNTEGYSEGSLWVNITSNEAWLATDVATSSAIWRKIADPALDDFSAMTPTKGNMVVGNGANFITLGVGTDDHSLQADSAQTEGIKWAQRDSDGGFY